MKIVRKILGVLGVLAILLEIVLILFILVMRVSGGVPSLFGYNIYVISSGSMEPELGVGDIILSRTYDGEDVQVGDVLTYLGKEGDVKGRIVTHRVVRTEGTGEGQVIVTQGTANDTADPPISKGDVLSVMVYKTVILGAIYSVITNVWGFVFLVAAPMVAMIVAEIVSLVKEWKRNKQAGDEDE